METSNINSCLMLGVNLITPVSLGCIFETPDLKDTGIELDSHITLLYAQDKIIPKENILKDIREIMGNDDYKKLMELCNKECALKVLDYFELGNFENDSDYVVLKLKRNIDLFRKLSSINSGLKEKYNVDSTFSSYNPHITLAELKPGSSEKYMKSEKLSLVLEETYLDFEDLSISYEYGKLFYLTQFKCIDRFFRLQKDKEDLLKLQ